MKLLHIKKKNYNFAKNPDEIPKKHNRVDKTLTQNLYSPYNMMNKENNS